jgi:serine/threonine-protein kinase
MHKIGNIQIIAEIKRSDFGATYRGIDASSQKLLLVKTFQPNGDVVSSADARSRFEQEAAIYAGISHPNIVKLVEYGSCKEIQFFALEFVNGRNLRDLIQSNASSEPLPPEIALTIFRAIAAGLQALHHRDVIHRDLKPENILVDQDGTVKICDFDLAFSVKASAVTGLTGTRGYLAPEIILGENVTKAADIFSCGVLLYEMLVGTRPFEADTVSGEMNAIVKLPHLKPSKFNSALPGQLDDLLEKLLAKNPSERFQNANEMLPWLEKHFDLHSKKQRSQQLKTFLAAPNSYQLADFYHDMVRDRQRSFLFAKYRLLFASILFTGLLFMTFLLIRKNNIFSDPPQIKQKDSNPISDNILENNRVAQNFTGIEQPKEKQDETQTAPGGEKIQPSLAQKNSLSPANSPQPQQETLPVLKHLTIQSTPWAFVFLDDDSLGATPLQIPAALREGEYHLVLKNPRFPLLKSTIKVDAQTPDTLVFHLWQKVSQLELKITPWADIYLNDKLKKLSPDENRMILLPGKYVLRFVHPTLGERTETIFLQAGELRQVAVNMF